MDLESLLRQAHQAGASDLHLEPGLPPALRIRGQLHVAGEPVLARTLEAMAHAILGPDAWTQFLERHSYDLSKSIAGVRCRINVLRSSRGTGLAIRLLSSFQATLDKLNLHPDLKKLVASHHGLILISGPTGSGKSTTMAALIQEINFNEARHIITIESPIEYALRPRLSYIRQREVGRDTPSFEQALLDALREDPDVLMVGEMRDPQTMRLTLNAAETGHLVLATVHSGTCAEALQRLVCAFPAEIQSAICAQLADCLVGVVTQRLFFRPDLQIRVPECEVLIPTNPVKAHIRSRDFFRIMSVMETGAESGMWTFPRYRNWLQKRTKFHTPTAADMESTEDDNSEVVSPKPLAVLPPVTQTEPGAVAPSPVSPVKPDVPPSVSSSKPARRIEIEPVEGGLDALIDKLRT